MPGCVLGVVADGMGGKSGGRKASDQVLLTAQQLFERYSPSRDDAAEALKQLVHEAHLMIKLTAITSEEEPHSTSPPSSSARPATATSSTPAIRASTTSAAPSW